MSEQAKIDDLVRRLTAEAYLGDGLYASYDGFQVCLRASGREHIVFLDDNTMAALLRYNAMIGGLVAQINALRRTAAAGGDGTGT